MRDDQTVDVKHDRPLIQRCEAESEVFPGEIRHPLSALAYAALRPVEQNAQEG